MPYYEYGSLVPYGGQYVVMGNGYVPHDNENDACPYCEGALRVIDDGHHAYYEGVEDEHGVKYCSEVCITMRDLDARYELLTALRKSAESGNSNVARYLAAALTRHARGLEVVEEILRNTLEKIK